MEATRPGRFTFFDDSFSLCLEFVLHKKARARILARAYSQRILKINIVSSSCGDDVSCGASCAFSYDGGASCA